MTLYIPLETNSSYPPSPSFLKSVLDPENHIKKVFKAILKAKRIAVVCGAGISVQAGIPDFRSTDGLFQTIKRDNPREALSSGKDLFDASVFHSEQKTALFCQMIASLSNLSSNATPTPFHQLLRTLDDRGKLLRVYTQNIDALEFKAGLTFGIPEFIPRSPRSRSKSKLFPQDKNLGDIVGTGEIGSSENEPTPTPITPSKKPIHDQPKAGPSRLPTPPIETPRCIPLHGTLQNLHCQTCTTSFPLPDHLPSLESGTPPDCPDCLSLSHIRQLEGKRPRGVGKLRPSVVLYNEEHRHGEGVAEVASRDLANSLKGKGRGKGADLLIVVGTSLKVPGTKKIVRAFSKAVRASKSSAANSATSASPASSPSSTPTNVNNTPGTNNNNDDLPTPSPSPRRTPVNEQEPAIKTIFLNFDFPVPAREWDGVFDVWVQSDAQRFAEMLREEMERIDRAREAAAERRRRREEEALAPAEAEDKDQSEENDGVSSVLSPPPELEVQDVARGRKAKPVKKKKGNIISSEDDQEEVKESGKTPASRKRKRKAEVLKDNSDSTLSVFLSPPPAKKKRVILHVKEPISPTSISSSELSKSILTRMKPVCADNCSSHTIGIAKRNKPPLMHPYSYNYRSTKTKVITTSIPDLINPALHRAASPNITSTMTPGKSVYCKDYGMSIRGMTLTPPPSPSPSSISTIDEDFDCDYRYECDRDDGEDLVKMLPDRDELFSGHRIINSYAGLEDEIDRDILDTLSDSSHPCTSFSLKAKSRDVPVDDNAQVGGNSDIDIEVEAALDAGTEEVDLEMSCMKYPLGKPYIEIPPPTSVLYRKKEGEVKPDQDHQLTTPTKTPAKPPRKSKATTPSSPRTRSRSSTIAQSPTPKSPTRPRRGSNAAKGKDVEIPSPSRAKRTRKTPTRTPKKSKETAGSAFLDLVNENRKDDLNQLKADSEVREAQAAPTPDDELVKRIQQGLRSYVKVP